MFGDSSDIDIIILDSNKIGDNWCQELSKEKPDSEFEWSKLTDKVWTIEDEFQELKTTW